MGAENIQPHAPHEDRAWPPWLSAAPAVPGTPQALSKCPFPVGHPGPFPWAAEAEQGCCGPNTCCGTAPHPSKEPLTLLYHVPPETSSPSKDLGIHLSSNKHCCFPPASPLSVQALLPCVLPPLISNHLCPPSASPQYRKTPPPLDSGGMMGKLIIEKLYPPSQDPGLLRRVSPTGGLASVSSSLR